jgi:hypothetical protein
VLYVNLLVSMLNSNGLGGSDGVLHFFGESIKVHTDAYGLDAKS